MIRKPETAQQKAIAFDWWLLRSNGCPIMRVRVTLKARDAIVPSVWSPTEAGATLGWDRGKRELSQTEKLAGWFLSMESKLKSIFKVLFRQSSTTSVLTIAGHVPCPLGLYTDYICPSEPTRPRHREENRESGRPVRSSINLWSVRKREQLEMILIEFSSCCINYWFLVAPGIFSHWAFSFVQQTRCLGRIHVTAIMF